MQVVKIPDPNEIKTLCRGKITKVALIVKPDVYAGSNISVISGL